MKSYPAMINVEGRDALVIGGGRVALRKVRSLLEVGARVTVISPEVTPELAELKANAAIVWIEGEFDERSVPDSLEPALVFGTTDRRQVNVRIYDYCAERGIPCNIADVPDLCTFTVPAVVRRGDLTIAVSTGGASPALARRVRERLDELFGLEYAILTEIMKTLREPVLELGASHDENKILFMRIVDSNLSDSLRKGDTAGAIATLREILPANIDPAAIVEQAFKTAKDGE